MIQEKERGEITSEAEQLAGSVPSESAHGGPAPRKMVKCPSKTGINMNQREKRTGQVLMLVIGLAVILLMAGLVARFGVMEQYRQATGDETVTVFVSTASPYKFCDHVLRAIGETPAGDGVELLDQLHETTGTAIPRRLAALKGKARRFDLTCEKPGMDSVVLEFLK